jgi:rare lipoprotein A
VAEKTSTRDIVTAAGRLALILVGCAVLAGCASSPGGKKKYMFEEGSRWGKAATRRYNDGDVIPPGGGRAIVGKPYDVDGKTYVPREDPNYDRVGTASWYGIDFHGRDTANGEVYDRQTLSAAHTTLPIPSYARVTNLENGRSVVVRVNDRGPYIGGREIDLSEKAADLLGYKSRGVAKVRVQYVGPASVDGSDQRMLASTLREGGRPSVAADRALIARAEGGTMPATYEKPVMVARLDTPAAPQTRPQLAQTIALAGQPTLPPVRSAQAPAAPAPAPAHAASLAPLPPARPQAAPVQQAQAQHAQPTIPSAILAAVRPNGASPSSAPMPAPRPVQASAAPMPTYAPAPRPTAAAQAHPDDSLPAGWYVPSPTAKRSFAADMPTALAPVFARVDRSETAPMLDLGLYSDVARIEDLRRAFSAYGVVQVRAVDNDGRVRALTLRARDEAAALSALAEARARRTSRAVFVAAGEG